MSQTEQVVYELNLRDGFSRPLDNASSHVSKFEEHLKGLGERVAHVAEAFGVSFALFKGIEFIHEGIESMEKLHQAEAQLKNTMENMGTYTEESFEKMIKGAGDLAAGVKFSRSEVVELQSQLGLVGSIGEDEMGRITKVSADLATKMGMGLTEAGNLLAKAINAPEMARRLGMALKIDPAVMKQVQDLAKHGHEAEARMQLLAIAEEKVGGAAQAAFNADPLSQFNKTMAGIKNDVGDLAIQFLKFLAPALEWTANEFRSLSKWMHEHTDLLKAIGIGMAVAGTAYALYTGYLYALIAVEKIKAFWDLIQIASLYTTAGAAGGLSVAMTILTAVQYGLNAAMEANPIGIIIVAIGLLVSAVTYCYNHFRTFHAILSGVWESLKAFAEFIVMGPIKVFTELALAVMNIFHPTEMVKHLKAAGQVVFDGAKEIGTAFQKGYEDGLKGFDEDHKTAEKSAIPGVGKKISPVKPEKPTDEIKEPKNKANGSKSVTINVTIQKLGETHISVTNMKDGSKKLHDAVTEALTGAVNDFQIVAEH